MRTLALAIILLALSGLCHGGTLVLNEADSCVRCTQKNPAYLSIEINIGALFTDSEGRIALPPQIGSYARYDKLLPRLTFNVALPESGEFSARTSLHAVPTDIANADSQQFNPELVTLSKPYWLRDIRGMEVSLCPFTMQDGKLAVMDQVRIDLIQTPAPATAGAIVPTRKLNPYFLDIYKQHFINFAYRYADLAEYGSMAVICPAPSYDPQILQFADLIQPWVDWKNQKGIPTTVYNTSVTGSSYPEIKGFIQNLYDHDPNLTFVQLVGDFAQLPCLVTTMSGNTGGMDAFYTLLEGDDYYPDIFVGRFSAETAADLYTQIKRSLEYEKNPSSGAWLNRAAGVCSDNPPIPGDDDEHNWDHLDNIRAQLLDYGYTQVDRIYANEGATLQDLVDILNEGRSLVNYCGEGYTTHWVNPPFSVSDAANLTNTGMLPFIHVVSCWTGQFYNGTCLSEALLRSRDATAEEARGAIAVYAAAPEQGIAPPMEAQDHALELLINGTKNTIGGLCYNGSCSMIDEYGELGGIYNFLAWNLFGDASLVLRTKQPEEIAAILPAELPPNYANLDIDAGAPDILVALSQDNVPVTSGFSGEDGIAHLNLSDLPQPGDSFLLTLSGFNRRPIQRQLNCYGYGDHAVLDLTLLPSGQFIEPEIEIFKTVRIINRGTVAAANVIVQLWPSDPSENLTPMTGLVNLGQILPGQQKEGTLSYKVNKGTQDMSTVHYTIAVGNDGQSYAFSDLMHAPLIVLESLHRSPQPNWINPGDSFDLTYKIRNSGSAVLRDLGGVLESCSDPLLVTEQDNRQLTLAPNCADSLTFRLAVSPGCPTLNSVTTALHLDALNSLGYYQHNWLVATPEKTMESFESRDLQAFPWLYQSSHWTFDTSGIDGNCCLRSQAVGADSISLQLSFIALQAGEIEFFYNVSRNASSNDIWTFRLNQDEISELTEVNWWSMKRVYCHTGQNTVNWVGRRDPANGIWTSNLMLDAIQFSAKTVFDNAQLVPDLDALEIILAPGEIRQIPLRLSSLDGKYIHYDAVSQIPSDMELRSEGPRITCNKSMFEAGTAELFIFSLHNAVPNNSLINVNIELPDGILATSASPFALPGQASLPFVGGLGSFSELDWHSDTGSMADSLRSGVRMSFDSGTPSVILPYNIESLDPSGQVVHSYGELELNNASTSLECLAIIVGEGELQDEETAELLLTANQNLMRSAQESYTLSIYYNGSRNLSIPVRIVYDENPPGFYDTPRLINYPNPAKVSTVFAYSVIEDGLTTLTIYNIRGQKVKTLVDADLDKGYFRSTWQLDDDRGEQVASGIYFCRLRTASGQTKVLRCAVIR